VTGLAFFTDGVTISRHKSDVSGIMLFYTMKQTVVPKSSCWQYLCMSWYIYSHFRHVCSAMEFG